MRSSPYVCISVILGMISTGTTAGRLDRIEDNIKRLDLKLQSYSIDISNLKEDMADSNRKLDLILALMNDTVTMRKSNIHGDDEIIEEGVTELSDIKATMQSEIHRIRRAFVSEKQRLMKQQTEYKIQFQEYAEKLDNAVIKLNERHQTKWADIERSLNESIGSVLDSVGEKVHDQIRGWNESIHETLNINSARSMTELNRLNQSVSAWNENVDETLIDIDRKVLNSVNATRISNDILTKNLQSNINSIMSETKQVLDKLNYEEDFNRIFNKISGFEDQTTNLLDKGCQDGPTRSSLRLASGTDRQGRLEVHFNGKWGTVCDDYFNNTDATVACRMLGFSAGTFKDAAYFGQGSGPIWMDDVNCRGTELSLFQCSYTGDENCSHSEDVGVICSN